LSGDDDPKLVGAAAPLPTKVVASEPVLARRVARVKVAVDRLPHSKRRGLAALLNRPGDARADVPHALLALDSQDVHASMAARELAGLGALHLARKVEPSIA
jgi:hypothetical protein